MEVLFETECLFNVNDFGEALPFAFRVFYLAPSSEAATQRCF